VFVTSGTAFRKTTLWMKGEIEMKVKAIEFIMNYESARGVGLKA
jgi:hypothetical protein